MFGLVWLVWFGGKCLCLSISAVQRKCLVWFGLLWCGNSLVWFGGKYKVPLQSKVNVLFGLVESIKFLCFSTSAVQGKCLVWFACFGVGLVWFGLVESIKYLCFNISADQGKCLVWLLWCEISLVWFVESISASA